MPVTVLMANMMIPKSLSIQDKDNDTRGSSNKGNKDKNNNVVNK